MTRSIREGKERREKKRERRTRPVPSPDKTIKSINLFHALPCLSFFLSWIPGRAWSLGGLGQFYEDITGPRLSVSRFKVWIRSELDEIGFSFSSSTSSGDFHPFRHALLLPFRVRLVSISVISGKFKRCCSNVASRIAVTEIPKFFPLWETGGTASRRPVLQLLYERPNVPNNLSLFLCLSAGGVPTSHTKTRRGDAVVKRYATTRDRRTTVADERRWSRIKWIRPKWMDGGGDVRSRAGCLGSSRQRQIYFSRRCHAIVSPDALIVNLSRRRTWGGETRTAIAEERSEERQTEDRPRRHKKQRRRSTRKEDSVRNGEAGPAKARPPPRRQIFTARRARKDRRGEERRRMKRRRRVSP